MKEDRWFYAKENLEPLRWETEFLTLLSQPSQSILTLISTVYSQNKTNELKGFMVSLMVEKKKKKKA